MALVRDLHALGAELLDQPVEIVDAVVEQNEG
jgi:hypothetical protein